MFHQALSNELNNAYTLCFIWEKENWELINTTKFSQGKWHGCRCERKFVYNVKVQLQFHVRNMVIHVFSIHVGLTCACICMSMFASATNIENLSK